MKELVQVDRLGLIALLEVQELLRNVLLLVPHVVEAVLVLVDHLVVGFDLGSRLVVQPVGLPEVAPARSALEALSRLEQLRAHTVPLGVRSIRLTVAVAVMAVLFTENDQRSL